MRKRTVKQKLAIIDAILALNAAMLDEEQVIFVTSGHGKGWIRIGERGGGGSRFYPNADNALEAAWEALRRTREATGG